LKTAIEEKLKKEETGKMDGRKVRKSTESKNGETEEKQTEMDKRITRK
jgi:hypothetical protein